MAVPVKNLDEIAPAAAPAKKKTGILIGAAVAAVVLIALAWFGISRMLTPAATTYVQANGVPYCHVKYLELEKGGRRINVELDSPIRIPVPPGEYKIVVTAPDGSERTGRECFQAGRKPGCAPFPQRL